MGRPLEGNHRHPGYAWSQRFSLQWLGLNILPTQDSDPTTELDDTHHHHPNPQLVTSTTPSDSQTAPQRQPSKSKQVETQIPQMRASRIRFHDQSRALLQYGSDGGGHSLLWINTLNISPSNSARTWERSASYPNTIRRSKWPVRKKPKSEVSIWRSA